MNKALAYALIWVMIGGIFLVAPGCGSLGSGRTMNPAQRVNSNDPLFANKTLQNSHKNHSSPVR